jgi:L-ascorbate metabolism protein UlaG (beta-lactamase superfamily)
MEWETCYWLFDYYKGTIPNMDPKKKLFVFASHSHGDHYNPQVLNLSEQFTDIEYILSSDIKPFKNSAFMKGSSEHMADKIADKIVSVKANMEYEFLDQDHEIINLKTLKSTDCGVAFLLNYKGKTIYHAGDLNLWVWKEESKQYNNNMTANFNKEMFQLKDLDIDIAFAPLDPRQEEWYYMGLKSLLATAKIKYVFPMHFWEKPSVIEQFKKERALENKDTNIVEIKQDNQVWSISL